MHYASLYKAHNPRLCFRYRRADEEGEPLDSLRGNSIHAMTRFKSIAKICRRWQRRYARKGFGRILGKRETDSLMDRARRCYRHLRGQPKKNTATADRNTIVVTQNPPSAFPTQTGAGMVRSRLTRHDCPVA
jgi:hypothetical protein